jgi:hypothetical protein
MDRKAKICQQVYHFWGILQVYYSSMAVCNDHVQYYSGLLGFWTLSIVRYSKKTEEHNVSETGSVSILRWGGRRHLLSLAR